MRLFSLPLHIRFPSVLCKLLLLVLFRLVRSRYPVVRGCSLRLSYFSAFFSLACILVLTNFHFHCLTILVHQFSPSGLFSGWLLPLDIYAVFSQRMLVRQSILAFSQLLLLSCFESLLFCVWVEIIPLILLNCVFDGKFIFFYWVVILHFLYLIFRFINLIGCGLFSLMSFLLFELR